MRISNSKGMALVEVMAIALVGTAAMFAMMNSMNVTLQSERRAQVSHTARKIQARVMSLLQNSDAWQKTIAQNTNMACLQNQTPCQATTNVFDLYDGTSAPQVYRTLASASSTGYGIDENGDLCPGPTDHAGTVGSKCAFALVNQWTADCGGAASCIDPRIEITVQLVYLGIAGPPLNTDAYSIGLSNKSLYPTPFVRNATAIQESFSAHNRVAPAATNGGGTCLPSPQKRLFNDIQDDYHLVVSVGGGYGITFKVKAFGTYRCVASAAGYSVGSFQINLKANSTTLATATGFAPPSVQATATLNAIFDVTDATTVYSLEQTCAWSGATPLNDLGVAAPTFGGTYTQNIFASLICVKLKPKDISP